VALVQALFFNHRGVSTHFLNKAGFVEHKLWFGARTTDESIIETSGGAKSIGGALLEGKRPFFGEKKEGVLPQRPSSVGPTTSNHITLIFFFFAVFFPRGRRGQSHTTRAEVGNYTN